MGENPLEYLDFGGALRGGFNMGLQVQQLRDNRRLQQEAAADRMIRLEIQRQQENRMMEQIQNSAQARRDMETQRAARQMASAKWGMDFTNLVGSGVSHLDAYSQAGQMNPDANQVLLSPLSLVPKKTEAKTAPKVQLTKEGLPFTFNVESGEIEIPKGAEKITPKATGKLEVQYTPEGLGYTVDSTGKVEMLSAGVQEKLVTARQAKQAQIEKQELVISNLEARQKRGVEKVDTTLGFGGRPIKESIEEEKAKLEVIKGNRKADVPFELPTPKLTNAPPVTIPTPSAPAATNAPISREKTRELFEKTASNLKPGSVPTKELVREFIAKAERQFESSEDLTDEQVKELILKTARKMARDRGYEF